MLNSEGKVCARRVAGDNLPGHQKCSFRLNDNAREVENVDPGGGGARANIYNRYKIKYCL